MVRRIQWSAAEEKIFENWLISEERDKAEETRKVVFGSDGHAEIMEGEESMAVMLLQRGDSEEVSSPEPQPRSRRLSMEVK